MCHICNRLILCLFTRKRSWYFVYLFMNKLENSYYVNNNPSRIEYVYNVLHIMYMYITSYR